MKKLILILALCVASLSAHANIFQVKNLSAAGSSVILIPGEYAKTYTIQNNGSNSVRLSIDGGAGYIDPLTGRAGTNPTPTTGYLLVAGAQYTVGTTAANSNGDPGLHKPVVAIMVTSTTTLDIITDDTLSQAPTT